jgi:plastocyanin
VGSRFCALEIASLLLPCAAIVFGCSENGTEASRTTRGESETRPAPGYEAIEVVNGGTITGNIVWVGEHPAPIEIEVPIHRERCGETQPSPTLALGRRGGVAGTVVWLENMTRGRPISVPTEAVEISIENCVFRPHIIAVPVGTTIAFRNAEPVLHNVHAMFVDRAGRRQTWFSEGLPELGAVHQARVERPGIVQLVDDAGHPWMLGWVHAFEHPYFGVSDSEGRFQLTGIPPGQYVLRLWHEGFRVTGQTESRRPVYSAPIVLSRPVTVSGGHDTPVDFAIGTASAEAAGD